MKPNALLCSVALAATIAALAPAPCLAVGSDPVAGATKEAIEQDWIMQDAAGDAAKAFTAKSGCDLEAKMVARVLDEIQGSAALRTRMDALKAGQVAGSDPRWRALYVEACAARRAARLTVVIAKSPRIVFTKHHDLGGSHYAYTEGQSDAQAERHFQPPAALCLLELTSDGQGTVRTLIDDPRGVIRDPDVSCDGKRILFAWKKDDRKDDYHLYEMDAATGKIRQLTFGLGFADYEACYLPKGDILFTSTRCVQIVDCWWTEVSNLYTCDKDGRFLRRLSFDQVHANYPTVMEDGRVIYTRWDYNDRGQLFPQPLYQMNPDGTAQTEEYGNNSWFPTTIMHARGIPGTKKILAILSGHHTRQRGKLAIVDPTVGRHEAEGVKLVAPVRETPAVKIDAYGQSGEQWQYPYPLTETQYLVTYVPVNTGGRRFKGRFGIYFMDIDGRRELLAQDPKISCNQPVPLASRKRPHIRSSHVDYKQKTGTYYVKDVYVGPGLKDVPRGTIKRLRVVELQFRAAGVGANGNGGPAGGALVSTPVSIRNGTWDVKVVLGSTPVYPDGSAMFYVPARTPVYFQLLDEKDQVVQSMRSWSTLQPGETFSCVGCHESKAEASPASNLVTDALKAGTKTLDPFYGPARGFSFPKMIQPILDKHCIACHDDRSKVPATSSRRKPRATQATKELVGAKPVLPVESEWQYTITDPGKKWLRADYSQPGWKIGKAGFGTRGTPGGRVYTEWRTKEIWLRRFFTLPIGFDPAKVVAGLRLSHDEDVEVYVNAKRVYREGGHITAFKDVLIDAGALCAGKNVIAVRCKQTTGGQFIDVALLVKEGGKGAKAAPPAEAVAEPPARPGVKKAFSLLSHPNLDGRAKREWSDSYLALTQNGRPNPIVNWLNVQSIPPMLPPYFAGSSKSKLMTLLREGHYKVKLSREELEKLACWIDLLVPYCGDYTEAAAWSDADKAKYARYQAKHDRMAELDAANIQALIAYQAGGPLPPAPTEQSTARFFAYRNVALNPADTAGKAVRYPHASSNSEYGNMACFAARCAIDGKTANTGHGPQFPSWGPDKRDDLWWKVEFGKPVEIDKVVIWIRAQFPHDRHWNAATLEFSDGSKQAISLKKTGEPQTFKLAKRTVTWMRITDLKQDAPPGWCALSEVQVWGTDAPASK